MSVTVADILKLPSLRQAKVLGGQHGLTKIVASISVLESTDPDVLVNGLFPQGEFFGSEIVITGFMNITDNIELQCANMKRLAEGGEVGLILFYVGVYLPKVDQRLIDLADELDFVLICMPEGDRSLRYGEVICDVMEYIYYDRARNESFVSEILARMTTLSPHQRTINTVLKMLSDRISASVILCDSSFHILNLIAWPRSLEQAVKDGLKKYSFSTGEQETVKCNFLPDSQIHRFTITPDQGSPMELLLIKEGVPLSDSVLEQTTDVVRLSINIWGAQHGEIAIHELVRAILQDDPIKMRRLADIFHIDVASIHEMWILSGETPESVKYLSQQMEALGRFAKNCADTVFIDMYEDYLLIFLSTPFSIKEASQEMCALLAQARQPEPSITLTRCSGLQNTADVRSAYLSHHDYLNDARKIFPMKEIFHIGEMEFAQYCHNSAENGEDSLKRNLSYLDALHTDAEGFNVLETLSVFLLDGDCSVAKTAELLYLHKNTVKYRLKCISELLGCRPDKMPESMKLYEAVAIHRLIS